MMSFCEKTVHSLLSLSHSTSTGDSDSPSHHHCRYVPSTSGCFCLIAGDTQKPPNVFEYDAMKAISSPIVGKKDSNIFGLLDNVGNGLNGSCTENLGSESSDHPMEESLEEEELWRSRSTAVQSRCKMTVPRVRRQETNFPPPLPSLNQNGQPSFHLKPLRRNGRLELIEVRIQRPDIFRAFREDGRLRLQLIRSEPEHPPPPYQDDDQLEEQDPLLHSNCHHAEEEDEEEEIIEYLQEENIEEDDEIGQEEEEGEIIENLQEGNIEEDDEISKEEEEGEIIEIIENLEEENIEEDDEISQEEEEDEEREEGNRLSQWKLDGIWWRRRCHELNNRRPNHLLFGATAV